MEICTNNLVKVGADESKILTKAMVLDNMFGGTKQTTSLDASWKVSSGLANRLKVTSVPSRFKNMNHLPYVLWNSSLKKRGSASALIFIENYFSQKAPAWRGENIGLVQGLQSYADNFLRVITLEKSENLCQCFKGTGYVLISPLQQIIAQIHKTTVSTADPFFALEPYYQPRPYSKNNGMQILGQRCDVAFRGGELVISDNSTWSHKTYFLWVDKGHNPRGWVEKNDNLGAKAFVGRKKAIIGSAKGFTPFLSIRAEEWQLKNKIVLANLMEQRVINF